MTLKIPLEVEGIVQLQRGTWMLLTDPDVLPPHSLCFCLETDQPDNSPGKWGIFNK